MDKVKEKCSECYYGNYCLDCDKTFNKFVERKKDNNNIKILGQNINVIYFTTDERSPNMGQCNSLKNIIRINDDMNIDCKEETMLHEIIHMINNMLDLEITEKQVAGLSAVLYSVLKENEVL